MCHFVLVFFSPFSIAITSLGEERANLSAFRTFVRFVLVWICRFPLPLGVWEGLQFVIVALPGLFSYLFLYTLLGPATFFYGRLIMKYCHSLPPAGKRRTVVSFWRMCTSTVRLCIYSPCYNTKVLNTGRKLYCAFINYEKCFGKINRLFLWQKLLSENISCNVVRAIKSMYLMVRSYVRYKSSYSNFLNSYIGLKQGDPSSLIRFILFVNDI